MEATKIERKAPGDDVFTPPAGYKEIRMADMMMKAHNAMKGMKTSPSRARATRNTAGPDTKKGQGEPQAGPSSKGRAWTDLEAPVPTMGAGAHLSWPW